MSAIVELYPLNRGQEKAFNLISSFLSPLQTQHKFFRLSGYAGTGKTYLLKALHQRGRHGRAVFVGPTNKATKVIKRVMLSAGWDVEVKTVYSLLGIKMVSDEDKMVLEFPHVPTNLSGYDVVFADEASMYNKALMDYIKERSKTLRLKWIFLGDKAQIPPVGEKNSPVWKLDCPSAYLTDVERYDNEILEFATHVRKQVTSYPNVKLEIHSNHSTNEGVWKLNRNKFFHNLERYADNGEFLKPDNSCAIAWRNKTVEAMNQVIRIAMFGELARKSRWVPGDRLSVGEPISFEGKVIAHIEDEGTVVSSEVVHHSIYKDLNVYYLVVQMDDGPTLQFHVIHEDSESVLEFQLNALAVDAKKDRTKWKYFWVMKNCFHKVRYGFAKTAHRVQGSTYNSVFVDTADILANSNSREALRCLYVAATRPTDKLILT